MKVIKKVGKYDSWEEMTSHPEILSTIPRPMPGWEEHKSYCEALLPGEESLALKIAKIIGQPVVFARSQNLNLAHIEDNVLFLARCPYDDLGDSEVLLLGEKVPLVPLPSYQIFLPPRLDRGDVYRSPDGRRWLVCGEEGDPHIAESMRFKLLSDEQFEKLCARKRKEKEKAAAAAEQERE